MLRLRSISYQVIDVARVTPVMRLSTAMLTMAFLVSSVADPICGTMMAFGSSRSGSSTEGGSSSSTSSPASDLALR